MFIKPIKQLIKCRNIFKELQIRMNSKTVDVFVNGTPATVPSFYTIGQTLKTVKITIPGFCFHPRLAVAGNCRLCLVEIEGWNKLQLACATHVFKGMKIRTNSPEALRAQEGVLEFILANHPLDCPICDQGGECDLQDLSVRFGSDRSRFTDIHFSGKRAVENKELSPLIRAVMTRCIHCTRCIRFAAQVCGAEVLGTTGRGADMLVGTYVEKMFFSELSGNIIDLCPVGALTSIPYMFKARPWELNKTNSIDVTDATGTNIVIDSRNNRVLRILPREHVEINEEWLSDKGRWSIDSLEIQRLVTPMCKCNGAFVPVEWNNALRGACELFKGVKPENIMAIAGPYTNVETLVACKDFLNMLGCENTFIERDLCLTTGCDIRAGYSLNMKMCDIVKADKILFVGTNPRFEAPILNNWIRQAYRGNEADIYAVGPRCEYNYHVTYLGASVNAISKAAAVLKDAKNPLIFVGINQLKSDDGGFILSQVFKLVKSLGKIKDWQILHIIPLEASFIGALEAGWKSGASQCLSNHKELELIISLGADQIFHKFGPSEGDTINRIYVGFQGDKGAEIADLILPGSAYTESGGLYVNMECRSQFALPAISPPGKARSDWMIIRAIAECCGVNLPYNDHNGLCCRFSQISPLFTNLGQYQPKLFSSIAWGMAKGDKASGSKTVEVQMKYIEDYYCSDIFTYNSPTMVMTKKAANKYRQSCYASI